MSGSATVPASKVGSILSIRRVGLSVAAGLIAGLSVALAWSPDLFPLVSWVTAAGIALAWAWRIGWPQDHVGTKRLSEEEARSRSTTDTWVVLASVASLVAVAVALVRSSGRQDAVAVTSVLLSVIAVLLAWALVNTVFAFKYARLYYVDEPDAAVIDFKQEQPPAYSDFAYMAFTVGMSYAVSESEPTSTYVRKITLGHALLSFLLGTAVLAVAINLVTNLGSS